MLFLIIILLVIALGYIFYTYSDKLSIKQSQLSLLKKQNDELKNKVSKTITYSKDLTIEYFSPQNTKAKCKELCSLYVSPLETSIIINKLEKDSFLNVLDCAKINNCLWYEVSFQNDKRINNKGWIREDSIQFTVDSSYSPNLSSEDEFTINPS